MTARSSCEALTGERDPIPKFHEFAGVREMARFPPEFETKFSRANSEIFSLISGRGGSSISGHLDRPSHSHLSE